jgi:thiol:disulfide interchange protein
MSISLDQFQILTFAIFFLYVFFDTNIFLALWSALFHIIQLIIRSVGIDTAIYKLVITAYVIVILAGYLYVFRDVIISNKNISKGKLEALSSDKKRRRRIGIATLLLIIVNVAAVFVSGN